MMSDRQPACVIVESVFLTTCRFVAGGAFLLAAVMKLRDPQTFMLSIKAFELTPVVFVPFLAYAIPWMEIVAGLALIYGFWSRSAAILAGAIYTLFTLALGYVLLGGGDVDCGCFGGLFGAGTVTWTSIARNLVFLAACAAIVARGPGRLSVDTMLGEPDYSTSTEQVPTAEAGLAAEQAS